MREELGDAEAGSTELALANKALEVQDYANYEFKRMGVRGSWSGSRSSAYAHTAADSGRKAAERANIYGRRELEA